MERLKRDIKIHLLALAVIVLILASAIYLAPHLGWSVGDVISGSMSPTMESGTLVISRQVAPEQLHVGDVIIFRPTGGEETNVIHRIVNIKNTYPLTFQTKGDAYKEIDAFTVPASNVVGKAEALIAYWGFFVAFLKTGYGLVLCLVLPALIVLWTCLRFMWREMMQTARAQGSGG